MRQVLNIIPLAPVRDGGEVNIPLRSVTAITLRNGGETKISLWNGAWELLEGETLSFNVLENSAILDIKPIVVSFDTQVGRENKLQIIVTATTNDC